MPNTGPDRVQVAAAVIRNARGAVLIAQRPAHAHQGGLWEFPGGKREAGESRREALDRELQEELGIRVRSARPLISIPYDYPDRSVLLDVWLVTDFAGQPHGREGQPVRWVSADELADHVFPAANQPIVAAARLPERYLITGEFSGNADFLARLEQALTRGIGLVQLRAKQLPPAMYRELARQALARCRAHGAQLLLNADPALVEELSADGVHLTGERLAALASRPLGRNRWVAASVHSSAELLHAQRCGVDFVVAGPVLPTASHPQAVPLGWDGLGRLAAGAQVPVYALGGLTETQLEQAFRFGAQGIAAIRAFWTELA